MDEKFVLKARTLILFSVSGTIKTFCFLSVFQSLFECKALFLWDVVCQNMWNNYSAQIFSKPRFS